MTKMVSRGSEIHEVEFIYPLEKIALIASKLQGHIIPLLNGFKEYYETLEVKPIDVSTFKKNNFGRYGCSSKNRSQQSNWRRKNRFRGKDIERFLVNSYVKQLPQNDTEKIRKIIISNLNKLNEKKFTIIVKEFIDHLEEQMFFETYEILNSEIINKVSTDSHFVYLYAKLIKELIINKKWQKKMFNVVFTKINNEEGHYWTLNKLGEHHHDNEYIGPFETENEAIDDAMNHHNYKMSFCNFMEKTFRERDIYQAEIRDTIETFDLNIYAKNKYNNFLKLIFCAVEQGIFKIDLLHHVLISLILDKELEQFAYIYEQLHSNARFKLNNESYHFYEGKLNEVINQTVISPKIKFKLQEFFKLKIKSNNAFEALALIDSGESTEEQSLQVLQSLDRDISCIISEYPISEDYSMAKDAFNLISRDKYSEFTSSIILAILDAKESDGQKLKKLINNLWEDFSDYEERFESFIEENMINLYGEYEIDYPRSKELFKELILSWLELSGNSKDELIEKLKEKTSDDEDEMYNIELFVENIVDKL